MADADEPDFCALGFEPGEIAVQKELMEKFAQFAMKTPPEVARPPVSEANKITPKAVNPLARGPASAPPIDLATSAMSAVDDSFDLLAFKMDPSELRAQMEMMRQFERRPPAGLPLERPIDTARLDAGGYLDKGVGHSSRGVLSRPGGSALSKKLADSVRHFFSTRFLTSHVIYSLCVKAVEILSNGKSAVKPISSRSAAPANAHSSHIKVLGVSASRDDILLPSADQSRVARDHSVFTANDLPNLAVRPRSSKSDKTQSSQSRGELQQAMAIAGSKPRESAVVPQRRPLDAKPRVPTTVESRPIHAAMPDQGLMLVGAAPIPSRRPQPRATGEISLRAKLLNPKEGADVAAPIWLSGSVRGTDAMAAENGVTTSSRPQVFQASGSTAVSTSRSSKSNSSNSRNKGAVTGRGEESDHDRDYV